MFYKKAHFISHLCHDMVTKERTCIAMVFVDNNNARGKRNSHDKNQKERNQNTVISSVAPGILTFK